MSPAGMQPTKTQTQEAYNGSQGEQQRLGGGGIGGMITSQDVVF